MFAVRSPLISASLLFRCTNSRCTRCTGRVHNASAACGTWIAAMDSKPGAALHHLAIGRCVGDNFHILRGRNVGNQLESEILHQSFPFGAPARRSTCRALQKMQIYAATQLFFPRERGGKEGGTRDCTLCNAARTFISAINSSFFMFCFSVTRIPFSSRMALQRGSTLSLISTEVMEIGAMSTVCVYLCPRFARRGNWC